MGTTVELYLYAPDEDHAAELFEAAFTEIERVEAAFSTYRPASELSRINARAADKAVTTDPEVFGLIERAFDYSRRTDGAFDVTVGPLVKAWGFFGDDGRIPAPEELAEARASVGWQHVELDVAERSIQFRKPGIELDLGGIGKGFALDRAAQTLRSHGVKHAILGAGQSSYVAIGAPPGREGWPITVPSPHDASRALSTVSLRDGSLSTSGSDQKYFERAGRRYSHIIDPLTGQPVSDMLQVTVIALTAADADALSTALFVLGPDSSAALIEQTEGASALLVTDREGEDRVVTIGWTAAVAR